MEELFSNVFVLIPVALIVAIRIISAQKKSKQSASPPKAASPFPQKVPANPTVKKIPAKKAASKTGRKLPVQEAAAPVPLSTLNVQPILRAAPQPQKPLARIEELQQKYSPLQMGIIWSEILGPPKAESSRD
jgi:hypothetical protein